MNDKIMIIGASGQGKVVADIAKRNGYTEIAFLDDNTQLASCGAYPVVGTCEKAPAYADWDFIVAIGNGKIRKKVQEALMKNRLTVVSLVHPAATVADDVKIGKGTVVMAGAVINPSVQIGEGCIINTCASVDHDCLLEAYVHISVGAHVAGTVTIGQQTWVGAGAIVSNNVAIHAECIIGAGAVVIKDITESGTYIGVPAKKMPV